MEEIPSHANSTHERHKIRTSVSYGDLSSKKRKGFSENYGFFHLNFNQVPIFHGSKNV